jgi:hypothetical protein
VSSQRECDATVRSSRFLFPAALSYFKVFIFARRKLGDFQIRREKISTKKAQKYLRTSLKPSDASSPAKRERERVAQSISIHVRVVSRPCAGHKSGGNQVQGFRRKLRSEKADLSGASEGGKEKSILRAFRSEEIFMKSS